MKNTLTQLNILCVNDKRRCQKATFLVINNTDGSPRWICNANATKPLFLDFYLVSSFSSRIFSFAIRLVFFLRLQKLVFKTEEVRLIPMVEQLNPIVDYTTNNWALFTGTTGPNNKILITEEIGNQKFFYKVASTPKALSLIDNEISHIDYLNELKISSFKYPKSKKVSALALKMEDVSKFGNRSNSFTNVHKLALQEIALKTNRSSSLNTLPIFTTTMEKLQRLESTHDLRIPKGLVRKLRLLTQGIEFMVVDSALGHGDFTPWNMYVGNDKLAIYDWELARKDLPLGFDAFHFIIQKGILLDKLSWSEIKDAIDAEITTDLYPEWNGKSALEIKSYLKLYLLINTVNNLEMYLQQTNWHMQVSWLIDTWNLAISSCLTDKKEGRELVIMDVFDFMHPKNYAAVKFPNILPDQLSEYSDIDLCVEKADLKPIIAFLETHPLSHFVNIIEHANMRSVQLFLTDGGILSIDLIWILSRKSLVMLKAKDVLNGAIENNFGVKRMQSIDTARYVALFYGLNHSRIPEKFKVFELVMANGASEFDHLLYESYSKPDIHHDAMVAYLKTKPENSLWNRTVLTAQYFIDTVIQLFNSKGLTITFSGVDGAGKSTVIEKIRYEIEKKLRKKVVVLRHRPSVLPILSALVKGKEKAEQDSMKSLPRQGTNKSFIKSLFRFSYYYMDYLLGQFYVNAKYLRRGYVVLYDRYYFDFINDSKRSNIVLPKPVLKAGYRFLLKPDLNFFLFANPEVILARKKELDSETITTLTNDYLNLFEDLNTGSNKHHYAIENIELKKTINEIMDKTMNAVA
jgi:thymidylate kinase